MSSDIQAVILTQKGEIRQTKVKATTPAALAQSIATVLGSAKKKKTSDVLGRYTWRQKTLFLFGFVNEDGNPEENQHYLPPPLEGMTFYGDILVLASPSPSSYTKPVPLKTADYETFYNAKMEGEEEDYEEEDIDVEAEAEAEAEVEEEVVDEEDESEASEVSDDEEEAAAFEEEEVVIPVEKPVRASRARKQAVSIHDEPEIEANSPREASAHRKQVLRAIQTLFPTSLTQEQKESLEFIIFSTAYESAEKYDIRRNWKNKSFTDYYMSVARRICGNLNPQSYVKNGFLWERFQAGELTLQQIAKQNYYELCPEVWQTMVDRRAKREQIQLEGDFSRATDKYFCMGCKMRKCTYYELQTRSADEPMTIFIHCLNCGKRWTQ